MNKKLLISLCVFLAAVSSSATYAASKGSLWGDIDESVPSSKEIEQQQKALQDQALELQNQKTVCEIFSAQPTLTSDVANLPKIQDALLRAYKITLPEYQSLIANKDAANNLYKEYRNLYLSTYCTGVH
jgi:hypothetical protein